MLPLFQFSKHNTAPVLLPLEYLPLPFSLPWACANPPHHSSHSCSFSSFRAQCGVTSWENSPDLSNWSQSWVWVPADSFWYSASWTWGRRRLTPASGVFRLECLPASGSQWEALTECQSRRMPFSVPQVIALVVWLSLEPTVRLWSVLSRVRGTISLLFKKITMIALWKTCWIWGNDLGGSPSEKWWWLGLQWLQLSQREVDRLKLSLQEELSELGDYLDVVLERELWSGMTSRYLTWATGWIEMLSIMMTKTRMEQIWFCSQGKHIYSSDLFSPSCNTFYLCKQPTIYYLGIYLLFIWCLSISLILKCAL